MPELKIPKPSEKQRLFLADRHPVVAYGGARGGGKSWAVRVKAVLLCLRYPGITVMIVRKTYPELRENHILPLCAMLGCYKAEEERIAAYNDSLKMSVFDSGEPFDDKVKKKLGRLRVTTHKDEGGSGIGMMTTFEILKKYKASFTIDEQIDNGTYTKKVCVCFDGKGNIKI